MSSIKTTVFYMGNIQPNIKNEKIVSYVDLDNNDTYTFKKVKGTKYKFDVFCNDEKLRHGANGEDMILEVIKEHISDKARSLEIELYFRERKCALDRATNTFLANRLISSSDLESFTDEQKVSLRKDWQTSKEYKEFSDKYEKTDLH